MEEYIVAQKNIITTANAMHCKHTQTTVCKIPITIEHTFTLFCNSQFVYTFHCLPQQLKELAIEYLFARNYIATKKEIKTITITENKKHIHIITQPNNDVAKSTNSKCCFKIYKLGILERMKEFENISNLYKSTRATHTVALADSNAIVFYCEDISRHAALYKLLGHCLRNDILLNNYALLLSCRVTQSIAKNLADKGISIIASLCGVTDTAIKLCNDNNITLAGFVRNLQMYIFTDHKHVELD